MRWSRMSITPSSLSRCSMRFTLLRVEMPQKPAMSSLVTGKFISVQQRADRAGLAVHYHELLPPYGFGQAGAVILLHVRLQLCVAVHVVPELHSRYAVERGRLRLHTHVERRGGVAADLVAQKGYYVGSLDVRDVELASVAQYHAGLYDALAQDVGILLLKPEVRKVGAALAGYYRYAPLIQKGYKVRVIHAASSDCAEDIIHHIRRNVNT